MYCSCCGVTYEWTQLGQTRIKPNKTTPIVPLSLEGLLGAPPSFSSLPRLEWLPPPPTGARAGFEDEPAVVIDCNPFSSFRTDLLVTAGISSRLGRFAPLPGEPNVEPRRSCVVGTFPVGRTSSESRLLALTCGGEQDLEATSKDRAG